MSTFLYRRTLIFPIMLSASMMSAPIHGGDNEAIYGDWFGIPAEEVKDMRKREVI